MRGVRSALRGLRARPALRAMLAAYRTSDLLTYASAISFQVLFALIPLLLSALGVLGFLHLQSVWHDNLAPEIRPSVSDPAFRLIDRAATGVLDHRQAFWASMGALIAIWELSGAMRAVMGAFSRIYGPAHDPRPFRRRMLLSLGLALACGLLVVAAVTVAVLGPIAAHHLDVGWAAGALLFAVRWALVVVLLLVLVAMLVRHAPATRPPLHWVSFGALLVVVSWLAMSLGFYWYVRSLADYGSIFGGLATVIVLMTYLYASSVVVLTGALVDALARRGVHGAVERGQAPPGSARGR